MKPIFLLLGLSLLFTASGLQPIQNYTISGTVTDDQGQPIARAAVSVVGENWHVNTDKRGRFSLSSADSCVYLRVEHSDYVAQQIPQACSSKPVTVQLQLLVQPTEEMDLEIGDSVYAPASRARAEMKMSAPAMTQGIVGYSAAAMPRAQPEPEYQTEDYAPIEENRFYAVKDQPLSTFSADVDAAAYSNLRRFLNEGELPPADAVRIEEMINYFDYDYEAPKGEHPFAVYTELSECPWQPKHQLLMIGLQGKRIPTADLPPSNLVFLLDVSGSMDAPNKLPLLKESLKMLVDNLRPSDKVSIVVYAGAAGLVLEPTSGEDKAAIREALDELQAGGSTAGSVGIQLAYETARKNFSPKGNNRVILATDGDFNVGVSSDGELKRIIERERESGIFLTVLGFGMGNYKDNKLQLLADYGNGNHAYIDNLNEARKVLVNEFGGTLFTIAKDVKLQVEFNPAIVQGYRLIGYENRLLDNEDFNDDTKDAGDIGAGHTVTALYELIPAGVKTDLLADVDPLKYQQTTTPKSTTSREAATVKLRYKQPDGDKSKLLEQTINNEKSTIAQSSTNFRWAAAVAEFGLLLRDSPRKADATYAHCRRLAESALGPDKQGYRKEMLQLLDKAQGLERPVTADK